jgi:serine/threonine-protein kinase
MIQVGSAVGNYQVKSQIGEGGMGIVWLAEHPLIGRRMAIKVIHPTYARNSEAVSRFFTEAQAVNKIGHPNIVDVTDFGLTPDGECYFVMEYLDGQSLHDRLAAGTMDLRRGLHVAAQVCDALAASHAAGILHRDLKPDNIFLVKRGQDPDFAKVLDFGLAKLTTGDQKSSHKTRTGSMMGTPYYMAPEQCAGKADIDARADVYALGIILFEMVTGRVPFQGEGYGEIIVQHMTSPVPHARELNPSVPEWLDALIVRCLAKERSERVQSMTELGEAISAELAKLPGATGLLRSSTGALGSNPAIGTNTPPPGAVQPISTMTLAAGEAEEPFRPAGSRRGLLIGAGVAAVAAIAVVAVLATRGRGSKQAAAQPTAAAPTQPAPAPAPAAAPAAQPITIDLSTDPPGARVTRDDGSEVCAATPCSFKAAPEPTQVELTFNKPGYAPKKRTVSLAQSAEIHAALSAEKAAKPAGAKPTGAKPTGAAQPGDSDGLLKPNL